MEGATDVDMKEWEGDVIHGLLSGIIKFRQSAF
jgi:hypothetical protein